MNLKSLFSASKARYLEAQARLARRALRDHRRHEETMIRNLEIRARGLRLYAAWSRYEAPAEGPQYIVTWKSTPPEESLRVVKARAA